MGLEAEGGTVSGIVDLPVMPVVDRAGDPLPYEEVRFFTHTKYWTRWPDQPNRHIDVLRRVLRLSG
jgi:hypothetical protein